MAKAPKQSTPKNFEEAIGELESILSAMENGDVPLEESLVRYERGSFLIEHCRQVLGRAEVQIDKLTRPAGNNALDSDTDEAATGDDDGV